MGLEWVVDQSCLSMFVHLAGPVGEGDRSPEDSGTLRAPPRVEPVKVEARIPEAQIAEFLFRITASSCAWPEHGPG